MSRREVVRRVGNWVVYAATVGSGAALGASCGRTPLGEPFDFDGTNTLPTGTQTPTGTSPTPTPTDFDPCGCTNDDPPYGSPTTLLSAMIPLNGVAIDTARDIFVCHDAAGFYAMTGTCSHSGCTFDTNGVFSTTNLAGGFQCMCHGSRFNANGEVTMGPAGSPLIHYRMAIASDDTVWVDVTPPFADKNCRCP